jgi:hypothetical protein
LFLELSIDHSVPSLLWVKDGVPQIPQPPVGVAVE